MGVSCRVVDLLSSASLHEDTLRACGLEETRGAFAHSRTCKDLQPRTLAPTHAPAFDGDCGAALGELASAYEERFTAALHGVRLTP